MVNRNKMIISDRYHIISLSIIVRHYFIIMINMLYNNYELITSKNDQEILLNYY